MIATFAEIGEQKNLENQLMFCRVTASRHTASDMVITSLTASNHHTFAISPGRRYCKIRITVQIPILQEILSEKFHKHCFFYFNVHFYLAFVDVEVFRTFSFDFI